MSFKIDMAQCVDQQLRAAGLKLDAGETAAFSRELEFLQAQALETKYPELKWRSLVPIKTGIPLGARSHTYRTVEGFGRADLLDNMATEDFPTAEVKGTEFTGVIRSLGAKYIYTVEDLRASAMMSIQVDAEKAKTARRVIEHKFEDMVLGGAVGPFKGLAHDDNATASTPVHATWTYGTATDTESNNVANTFRGAVKDAFTDTKGIFSEFDFVVSPALWNHLSKRSGTTSSDKTILDYLLSSVPGVRSISWSNRLTAAGGSGKERMLCYPRDPAVLEALVPIDFEQFAPQLNGMAFTVHCHAKYGGLRVYHPLAVRRLDITVA